MDGTVNILPDKPAAIDLTAGMIVRSARDAIATRGRFTMALSGGTTPRPVYELLAKADLDWSQIHIFFGDERCVPPDDEQSNYHMVHQALLHKIPIPTTNIHRIRGEVAPMNAAEAYKRELQDFFALDDALFDLNLLGMGEDGHTAGLFPNSSALQEQQKWVIAHHVAAKGDLWRITLTFPAILKSRQIIFLALGEKKAPALNQVLHGELQPQRYPSQTIVHGKHDGVSWIVDEAAASLFHTPRD